MIYENKIIAITGAASGIGRALAVNLSRKNNTLILIGRNETALLDVKKEVETNGSRAEIFIADLINEKDIERISIEIKIKFERIDVLINNAGVSQRGLAMQTDLKVDRAIFELNYFSTIQLTRNLFPLLQKSNQPRIVIVSSMAGKFGFPYRSSYSASKQALHGFFESMQLELMNTNLKITFACPGRVKTEISLKALTEAGVLHNKMDDGQMKGIDVNECAAKIIAASEKGKYEIFITQNEHWLWYIKKWSNLLFLKIASRFK